MATAVDRCDLCTEPVLEWQAEVKGTSKPGDTWATCKATGRKRRVCREHVDAPWGDA